jgi:hypothetical protein
LFHFLFLFFSSSHFPTRRKLLPTDKKVINSEHFARRNNELVIKNAAKHLSGYYSCVVEFLNSGAKLETPQELINIVGEYHGRGMCCYRDQRDASSVFFIKNFFVQYGAVDG